MAEKLVIETDGARVAAAADHAAAQHTCKYLYASTSASTTAAAFAFGDMSDPVTALTDTQAHQACTSARVQLVNFGPPPVAHATWQQYLHMINGGMQNNAHGTRRKALNEEVLGTLNDQHWLRRYEF